MNFFLILRMLQAVFVFGSAYSAIAVSLTSTNALLIYDTKLSISRIYMVDSLNGWAWTEGKKNGKLLLRTCDGGSSWLNVTPDTPSLSSTASDFISSQDAWVFSSDEKTQQAALLHTSDGGISWIKISSPFKYLNEDSTLHFFDTTNAIAMFGDYGLGSVYYNLFKTEDGGETWKPLSVASPKHDINPGVPSNTFHLSSLDHDQICFNPPSTIIVTYGDVQDYKPSGILKLTISTNLGRSWQDLKLSLPTTYEKGAVYPLQPMFFSAREGVLPVYIRKMGANTYGLAFYTTDNGGSLWKEKSKVIEFRDLQGGPNINDIDIISYKDIVVRSAKCLYITTDSAENWRIVTPTINLGGENSDRAVQFNFIDLTNGWSVIKDNAQYRCFNTKDGGITWEELN